MKRRFPLLALSQKAQFLNTGGKPSTIISHWADIGHSSTGNHGLRAK